MMRERVVIWLNDYVIIADRYKITNEESRCSEHDKEL